MLFYRSKRHFPQGIDLNAIPPLRPFSHHVRREWVKRGQILLAAARGHSNAAIATTVGVGTSTVYRTKRRFVEAGVEMAFSEEPRAGARRKFTGREETCQRQLDFSQEIVDADHSVQFSASPLRFFES